VREVHFVHPVPREGRSQKASMPQCSLGSEVAPFSFYNINISVFLRGEISSDGEFFFKNTNFGDFFF
jgi:hypothetical protein